MKGQVQALGSASATFPKSVNAKKFAESKFKGNLAEEDGMTAALSDDELVKVKKKFREKAKSQEGDSNDLDKKAFKELVVDLLAEAGQEAPSRKDLDAAFILADEDKGGTVDEQEFANLYRLIQGGGVKGLGGGNMFLLSSKKLENKKRAFKKGLVTEDVLSVEELETLKVKFMDKASYQASGSEDLDKVNRRLCLSIKFSMTTIEPLKLACVLPARDPQATFKEFVKELMVELGETDLPTNKDLEVAFIIADEDCGGTVDQDEFVNIYRVIKKVRAPLPN
jgi:Ca2+-binding EF-hand superfamily protein